MAITPAGDVFVRDGYGNARVVHFDKDGKFVKEWGELGSKPGQFSIPHAIAVDSQGPALRRRPQQRPRAGLRPATASCSTSGTTCVVPWGFCVTQERRDLGVRLLADAVAEGATTSLGCPPKDQVFMKFNPDGKLLQLWTVPKGADGLERPGEVNWVHAIAVDSKGNLYAGDIIGKRAEVRPPGTHGRPPSEREVTDPFRGELGALALGGASGG